MAACPSCGSSRLEPLFSLPGVPVLCNQLWPSADAARAAPVGDVDLVLCSDCALISNGSFSEAAMDYAPGYQNPLHFSPRFQDFAAGLAADLVARHSLAGKDVVEIGCGDGFFLEAMVRAGAATATGFDPTMAGTRSPHVDHPGVSIVPEYFHAGQLDRPFAMLLCRHVLEHLSEPAKVLGEMRTAIGSLEAQVYFEVPNAGWMLDSLSLWDVIYEHVTYWTEASLDTLFRRAGFAPGRSAPLYGDQFLMIEAAPAAPVPDHRPDAAALADVTERAAAFAEATTREVARWSDRLQAPGTQSVVWGAGSKGITFCNITGGPAGAIAGLVDVNPGKQGMFIPGAGLPVLSPDDLAAIAPNLVLISNELYLDEIRAMLLARNLTPEIGVIAG